MLDLTGLPALDLAIGLAFIFFLLSTLAATIQEFIAAILGLRARTLEQGLRSLLEDPERGWVYVDRFYDHALIRSLYRTPPPQAVRAANATVAAMVKGKLGTQPGQQAQSQRPASDERTPEEKPPAAAEQARREVAAALGKNATTQSRGWFARALAFFKRTKGPSYISPRSFALVVLDNFAPREGQKTVFEEGMGVLDELPDGLGKRLKPLVDSAQNDVEKLRTNLEAWYDDTMARVSGWYKRKTQIILIVIGVVLVPAINANTIAMAERMWKDDTVRSAVVAQAQANASAKPASGTASAKPATGGKAPSADQKLNEAADNVDKVVKVGIPMGWRGGAVPHGASAIAMAIGGWVLTILAISLGAPFWFDTLSRFSRLRSSGKPETPLPAAGSGKANERILTPPQVPTVVLQHQVAPESRADKPGRADGGEGP
jgi:hypothetical protein